MLSVIGASGHRNPDGSDPVNVSFAAPPAPAAADAATRWRTRRVPRGRISSTTTGANRRAEGVWQSPPFKAPRLLPGVNSGGYSSSSSSSSSSGGGGGNIGGYLNNLRQWLIPGVKGTSPQLIASPCLPRLEAAYPAAGSQAIQSLRVREPTTTEHRNRTRYLLRRITRQLRQRCEPGPKSEGGGFPISCSHFFTNVETYDGHNCGVAALTHTYFHFPQFSDDLLWVSCKRLCE